MTLRAAGRTAVALVLCLLALPLAGWSNGRSGGDSFGTHDWVLYQAHRVAVGYGVQWLDWAVAQPMTDDPDMVLHDTYHHVYDIWGSTYGDAPTRVQALYDQTVTDLRAGDRQAASRTFGLLSHYYADICQPMHTDQCPAENAIHSPYELAAQTFTDTTTCNASWVVSDGPRYVPNAAAETVQAATYAHTSYAPLVSEFAAKGMDADVLGITRRSLNRAANDLADLMLSAERDAHDGSLGSQAGSATAAPTTVSSAPSAASTGPATPPTAQTASTDSTPSLAAVPTEAGAAIAGDGSLRSLLFWVVVSAAFVCALFGALYAKARRRA